MTEQKTRLFQFEDLLIIAWLIFFEPFLERQLPGVFAGESPLSSKNPILGCLFIASAVAGLFCIALNFIQHGLEGKSGGMTLEQYANYPMFALTGLFVSTGVGMSKIPDGVVGTGGILIIGSLIYLCIWQRKFLARISPYRRILMTPAIILGTLLFTDFITSIDIADELKKVITEGITYLKTHSMDTVIENIKNMRSEVSFSIFMIFMIFCGILAQYVLFIIAPRKVGGSGGSFFQWFLRFILYMVGVIFNVGLLKGTGV